jgi:two-component system response regulator FlrC
MIETLNILVVEDDAALRDAVCFTLELAHHRVTGADGGPAALEAIERDHFNLVITDLRMSRWTACRCWARFAAAIPDCRCC